jgi:nucleoside-triphosphatase THEP1
MLNIMINFNKNSRGGNGTENVVQGIECKVLLTGPPGCGKTTVARKVTGILGSRAVGFFTEEVRDAAGTRTGFRVESTDGRKGDLSSKRAGPGPRVGAYVVDVEAFESVALPSLAGDPDKVFIIDEIGKMECFSAAFRARVREILDSGVRVLATIPARGGGPFLEEIRNRADAAVIFVTRTNRDHLPEEIGAVFQR